MTRKTGNGNVWNAANLTFPIQHFILIVKQNMNLNGQNNIVHQDLWKKLKGIKISQEYMYTFYHSIIWMNRSNMKEKTRYLSFLVN